MGTIKDWGKDERPREKMLKLGAQALTNAELIALLVNSGTRDKSAIDLSRDLLQESGHSLSGLSRISLDRLRLIPGIGTAKATRIAAVFELASRLQGEPSDPAPTVTSSECVSRIFRPLLRNLQHEECWVLYLNRSNRILAKERISSGGVSATVVDIRMIIKKAVEKLASSIILVHNHPSGNPYPGEHDRRQTRLLKEAASLLDISLLDHVIIAGDKYYSFTDEGVG